MSLDWTPPSWWYTDQRPSDDASYFENLTHCIFQAGLNWQVIANKWPNFKKAFHNFDIAKIAAFGEEDIKRLREDSGIIRNASKIAATINNAKEFESIASEDNGFQNWLDNLDKSDNYAIVVAELKARFKHVGDLTARIFLHSVGEPLEVDESLHAHRS
ncbi:MAG: DNA-3-methyladenine glycosylase I [Nitrososphaerales archaeon]